MQPDLGCAKDLVAAPQTLHWFSRFLEAHKCERDKNIQYTEKERISLLLTSTSGCQWVIGLRG